MSDLFIQVIVSCSSPGTGFVTTVTKAIEVRPFSGMFNTVHTAHAFIFVPDIEISQMIITAAAAACYVVILAKVRRH